MSVILKSSEGEIEELSRSKLEQLTLEDQGKIVSISQAIDLVDPLAVYQTVHQGNQLHFYWENPSLKEAIACWDVAAAITIAGGKERFSLSRQFIENCQSKIIPLGGNLDSPAAGPRFCCSFTFFDYSGHGSSSFPGATIFLPSFQIVRQQNQCFLVANIPLEDNLKLELALEKLGDVRAIINLATRGIRDNWEQEKQNLNPVNRVSAARSFPAAVSSALKAIASQELSKIVLAHAFDFTSSTPFSLVASLHNLRQQHPDCYIFSTSNGRGDNFIGASPERLIRIQNQQLITDALAGSTQRGHTPATDARFAASLLNSEKEKREHQAVSDFITQRLYEVGLIPSRGKRQLMQLNGIQHLWTPIYAEVPSFVNPLDLVAQLHPTPAVAGVPAAAACTAIRRYETFDRSLYGAPLGWIDMAGNSEFIVAIRSGLIKENRARLYAGAGIVAGSDPYQEFAEVQLKLRWLLKALVNCR